MIPFLFLGVLLVLFLGALWFGLLFNRKAFNPKTFDYDRTFHIEVEAGYIDPDRYSRLEKQEVFLPSSKGYTLHAIWFPNHDSKKTVLLAHGHTYTLYGSIKYMDLFFKRGWNVLAYDHRYHGKSGGKNCSMGFHEKHDLVDILDWVMEKTGEGSTVATHGESMGAATVLLHAAIDHRVAFVVADCPYQGMWEQSRHMLQIEYHLPSFPLLHLADGLARFQVGASLKAMSPLREIQKIRSPVLFIHGDSDALIPKEDSIRMFEAKTGQKRLYLAQGAGHAQSLRVDPDRYDQEIQIFLDSIFPSE
ncbi:MAG TPA: alpha/beta fold hydrolase [Thermotogota bacterium]|nr:alpha/beta fold hydrolase [Thermotogota bacterium]HRW94161.1 alpha/beta fold hydrolase [Thermotogota bacterium]